MVAKLQGRALPPTRPKVRLEKTFFGGQCLGQAVLYLGTLHKKRLQQMEGSKLKRTNLYA